MRDWESGRSEPSGINAFNLAQVLGFPLTLLLADASESAPVISGVVPSESPPDVDVVAEWYDGLSDRDRGIVAAIIGRFLSSDEHQAEERRVAEDSGDYQAGSTG